MAKFVCSICGFTHDGNEAPKKCPVCMALASDFSEIKEVSSTDNCPQDDMVKDEVEEIIETEGGKIGQSVMTVESHFEENTNNIVELNKTTEPISNNTDIHGIKNENVVSANDKMDADEEEIVNLYKKTGNAFLVAKWYKETYHVDLRYAKDRVDFVLDKHGLQSITNSGSGCMITILIAISSTLSVFFLL